MLQTEHIYQFTVLFAIVLFNDKLNRIVSNILAAIFTEVNLSRAIIRYSRCSRFCVDRVNS